MAGIRVVPPTMGELIWNQAHRILMMSPMALPQYYTMLFNSMRPLLSEEQEAELDQRIKSVENMISDDYNQITLAEAELRMFQNMDLLSGFEVKGTFVTQMEINKRLDEIKQWLMSVLYESLQHIRFTSRVELG